MSAPRSVMTYDMCKLEQCCWIKIEVPHYQHLGDCRRHVDTNKQAIPLQAWTGPKCSRISRQLAHEGGKVVSPTHWPTLPPRKYYWYSFLLEDESTPVSQCSRKDYVNEKFQWHHRESNPRPSAFYHSATTNCATMYPVWTPIQLTNKTIITLKTGTNRQCLPSSVITLPLVSAKMHMIAGNSNKLVKVRHMDVNIK